MASEEFYQRVAREMKKLVAAIHHTERPNGTVHVWQHEDALRLASPAIGTVMQMVRDEMDAEIELSRPRRIAG